MIKCVFFVMSFLCFSEVLSQNITGTITDEHGQALPFATIFVPRLQAGTVTNERGAFRLKVDTGEYVVQFGSLGYYSQQGNYHLLRGDNKIDIRLKEQVVAIGEVTITNRKREDPAYPILRKAIGLAPYHLNMVAHYQSDVYLRGTMSFENIPWVLKNQIKVNNKPIKEGDVFVEESQNQISFDIPDRYTQKVLSIKSTFPKDVRSGFSPMSVIQESFYQGQIMEFVTPLSVRAFQYYRFLLESSFVQGNHTVNKIRVTPKLSGQNYFDGYIYIVDGNWSIHSIDMKLSTFYGKVDIRQTYAPINDSTWLPVSHRFAIKADIMGVEASFTYVATVKYSDVRMNKSLRLPPRSQQVIVSGNAGEEGLQKPAPSSPISRKIEKILSKQKLNNRDMVQLAKALEKENKASSQVDDPVEIKNNVSFTVEQGAYQRDSSYWNEVRPVPLDSVEAVSLGQSVVGTQPDSVLETPGTKRTPRAMAMGKGLLVGHTRTLPDSTSTFRYDGLANPLNFGFNTVDGLTVRQGGSARIMIDSSRFLGVEARLGYGFARKAPLATLGSSFLYAPFRRGTLIARCGWSSVDYSNSTPLNEHLNTLYTLLAEQNHLKLVERRYLSAFNSIDLANGLVLGTGAIVANEKTIRNHSGFKIVDVAKREYTSNMPSNGYFTSSLQGGRRVNVVAGVEFTPRYYYRVLKGRKHMEWSKYPTFGVDIAWGSPGLLGSESRFYQVEIGVKQERSWSLFRCFTYSVKAGAFVNKGDMFFSEFKHFGTQPLELGFGGFSSSFVLLGFYKHSTNGPYLEAHASYRAPFLCLKYLPWVRDKMWNENLYLHYLNTTNTPHYCEVGYSVSEIYLLVNAGVFASFREASFESVAFKIGVIMGD